MEVEGAAGVVGSDDADGPAGLNRENGIELPAFGDELGKRAEARDLIVEGGGLAMARVEGGRTFLGSKVVGVLREGRGGKVEVDTVRGAVERFRPRVGREPGESMELLQAHCGLQAIVGGVCAA